MNAYNAYKNTEILTASPEKLLLLLYEGAIRFNKHAIEAIRLNKLSDKSKWIGRTQDIITELKATLRPAQDPELSQSLSNLYDYISQKLMSASQSTEINDLQEVDTLLGTLYSGWSEAIRNIKQGEK